MSAVQSHGKKAGPSRTSPTIPTRTFKEDWCRKSASTNACEFHFTPYMVIMEIIIAFLEKVASSVNSISAKKRGLIAIFALTSDIDIKVAGHAEYAKGTAVALLKLSILV